MGPWPVPMAEGWPCRRAAWPLICLSLSSQSVRVCTYMSASTYWVMSVVFGSVEHPLFLVHYFCSIVPFKLLLFVFILGSQMNVTIGGHSSPKICILLILLHQKIPVPCQNTVSSKLKVVLGAFCCKNNIRRTLKHQSP